MISRNFSYALSFLSDVDEVVDAIWLRLTDATGGQRGHDLSSNVVVFRYRFCLHSDFDSSIVKEKGKHFYKYEKNLDLVMKLLEKLFL